MASDVVVALIRAGSGWIVDDEADILATEAMADVGPLAPKDSAIHGRDDLLLLRLGTAESRRVLHMPRR